MKHGITLLFLLQLCSPLIAQLSPSVPLSEEIVVTASATPDTLNDTSAAVSVISKDDMEERAARDVSDLLREVPGIQISRSGSAGKATSLFSRGGNSNHTLVLLNGIEINNPYFSGFDWGRLSTAGVQRIEIVRGPFSALHGSDAVAGVVNLLTGARRSGLDVDFQAGERGLTNGSIEGSWVARAFALSAAFEDRQDDGSIRNDDFSQKSATAGVTWGPTSRFSLGVTARRTDYELGIPLNNSADGRALVPSPLRRQSGDELQLSVPLSQHFSRWSYDLTLSESRRDDQFSDPDDPFGFTESSTRSTSRRGYLVARSSTSLGKLSAGVELERSEVDDESTFGTSLDGSRRTNRAIFVEDRVSRALGNWASLQVTLGARHDDFEDFGSQTSPRVAAALVAGRHKFRMSYGEGFRAPSIGELFFPFSGNSALDAERSRSSEAGYVFNPGPETSISATLFRNDFRNLIVFDNPTFLFQNIGRARSRGIEIGAETALNEQLRAGATYMYLSTRQDETGDPLLRRARHSGSVFASWHLGRTATIVALSYSGSRPDLQPVAPYSRLIAPSYTVADLTFRYSLGVVTPYLKIENAADEIYQEVTGYDAPRRRALIGLHYSLK
ncbi:MAG TPA: TonB-dependent receptor [Thermoanaerobaculia bacterium]|nr:TonB-dependent receptor [Thermoanaerobaculia bacterium]